ncbi:helix-turn-helix domain-containing protein [Paracoccus rhizosphaerae]|uniref:Helix-turn-helix domain-containing protein n=1 Tax=Paracoccus rhizosphaerae TaxID=1133347 RepID=A0ABV6CHD7_9RHOB|nr:helix-turn-helix domain-containing protein [Paracoccus rhizosphaerae]
MGYKQVDIVLASAITDPTEFNVLIALASHADRFWSCYPSIARICQLSRFKERAVQNAIKRLQARGALVVRTGGGRGGASYYTIIPSALNPAGDAPFKEGKPRSKNTLRDNKSPQQMHETPHLLRQNPAADAPEYINEPVKNKSSSADDDAMRTRREKILTIIGCDPSGVTKELRFTGTTADMAEVRHWNEMGLSEAEQDSIIRDMLARARIKDPEFIPSSWRYFTTGMAALVRAKATPHDKTTLSPNTTREQRAARRRVILGG